MPVHHLGHLLQIPVEQLRLGGRLFYVAHLTPTDCACNESNIILGEPKNRNVQKFCALKMSNICQQKFQNNLER